MNAGPVDMERKNRALTWGRLGFIGFAGLVAAGLLVGLFFPDSRLAWDCLSTCLTILIHAGLMRLQLSGLRLKYPRWYALLRVGWCAVSALLIIMMIWDNSWFSIDVFGVTLACWVGAIVSDPCARLWTLGWARVMAVLGLTSAGAFALIASASSLKLLVYQSDDETIYSILFLALGFAAYAGVRLVAVGPDDRRWTVHVPAWTLFVCSISAAALVWLKNDLGDDLTSRIALATGFIAVVSLVPATAALLTRRRARQESASTRRPHIDLICPKCKMNVQAATGVSACQSCGTSFTIEVRSPACLSCGYAMEGVWPICPECGANHGA